MAAIPRATRLLALALPLVLSAAARPEPTPIAGGKYVLAWSDNVSVPVQPGFAQFVPEASDRLVVTSFQGTPIVGKSAIYMYKAAGCSGDCLTELPGSRKINWPNVVTGLSESVFGFPALTVGSGFLVPTHATGGVHVLEASASPSHLQAPVKITADKRGWFYHLAVPRDMDGDGLVDLVTSRCQFGMFPGTQKRGELVWLQQPKSSALSGQPWEEHYLADGPDFLFCEQPGSKTLALAAPEFINERIMYYYMQDGVLRNRTLDSASGPGFSCSWADLDGDGRLELLATNHVNKGGAVYAYSFDSDDFATAAVQRHVLATGFSAVSPEKGTASPGDAIVFTPGADEARPYILVSGDNGDNIFVLVPRSQEAGDFSYTLQKIADLGSDIGRPAISDVDGDGFADVFVPAYDQRAVVHYEFGRASLDNIVVV